MSTDTSRTGADLLVIGAGLSGLMAAWQAARAGLRVRVIAKGLPSLHWTAGTVDVLGYTAAAPGKAVDDPLTALADLPEDHPYTLLGAPQVRAALDDFVALAQAAGLPYTRHSRGNFLLPTAAGALRPTLLAPQAQAAGDIRRHEPMLIVGFTGLRDFYPHLIAENLHKQGHAARAAMLPLSLLSEARDRNAMHLAHMADDPQRRTRLGEALKKLAQPGERIGLPALLGLEDHIATWETLQNLSGAPVFEIATLPPSVPGARLFQAIRRVLRTLGVRVDVGIEAIRSGAAQGRIEWIETATSARPLRQRAGHYLLATGGILGGGFDSDHTGRVHEVIFDLPLTIPQRRSQWFRPEFMNPAGHPVFQGGVAVTAAMQPRRPDDPMQPLYANLWAAGGALAGADPIQQRSLEGIALASGWAAAQTLARR